MSAADRIGILEDTLLSLEQNIDDYRNECTRVMVERDEARRALRQIVGYAVGKGLEAGALADIRAIAHKALDGDESTR